MGAVVALGESAKVTSDSSMSVLMPVEVSLRGHGSAIVWEIALVGLDVSINVPAGEKRG